MPEAPVQNRARRLVWVLLGGLIAIYILGAITGSLLYLWADGRDGGLSDFLLRKGPERLMRRMCLLWALLLLPRLLKELRWKGWSDFGFFPEGRTWDPKKARRALLKGFAFGLLTLGMIAVMHYASGLRVIDKPKPPAEYLTRMLRVTLQAITVGILEEVAMRGILFRTLARVWKPWIAAVVLSALFAGLHFVIPSATIYDPDKSWFTLSWQALASIPEGFYEEPFVAIQFINLALMGLVMTAVVIRTRTIWWAAGIHGGWVWIKLMSGFTTNEDYAFGTHHPFLGWRNDATDGWLATLLLLVMLANIVWWPKKTST